MTGLPMPSRRTFAAGILPFAHSSRTIKSLKVQKHAHAHHN